MRSKISGGRQSRHPSDEGLFRWMVEMFSGLDNIIISLRCRHSSSSSARNPIRSPGDCSILKGIAVVATPTDDYSGMPVQGNYRELAI